MTSIEQDIFAWASTRPIWQKNLLKRIARAETIDEAYVDSLAHSLVIDDVKLETPELSESDLLTRENEVGTLQLISIGDLKSVNSLLENQNLTFNPKGITVVYGDNGSGKSGYARIAKEIVGARHQEQILPDAFGGANGPQSAQVRYTLDGVETSALWPGLSDPALKQAHFYDEACGNDYIDRDTVLGYRPSALKLLDDLITNIDAVRAAIDRMIKANEVVGFLPPAVKAGSPAATFLESLSAATSKEELDKATDVDPNAKVELAHLVQEEARLRTTDPAKEKKRLSGAALLVEELADHIDHVESAVSPMRGDEILGLQARARELRAVSDSASSISFVDEPLNGVGTQTWRALWKAAENFSMAEAYPAHDFPATEDEHVCVLCQQPLQITARERLQRFHQFIEAEVAKHAQEAEDLYKAALESLNATEISSEKCTEAILFLASQDKTLADSLTAVLETAKEAKSGISARLNGATEAQWVDMAHVDTQDLRMRAAGIRNEATAIDRTVFAAALADCRSKLADVEGRIALSTVRDGLEKEIVRLDALATLKRIQPSISTKQVSIKSGNLARTYVTDAVRAHFVREAAQLKLQHVTLGDKGSVKGKVRHQPALLGALTGAPKSVLSEGEQTAAGLAGLFTEVEFDTTKSMLVLDDPMSSLDHERRRKAARRIVEIAEDRQVIVFTHDLVFLGEIAEASEDIGVPLTERTIERNGVRKPGRILEGHPWKAKDAKERIGALKEELDNIRNSEATWSAEEYERATSEWAGKLSETWERIIRSEIAFKLVDRSTTEVRPKMFRIVASISNTDDSNFLAGYGASSEWSRRHDKSEELNYVPPTTAEMQIEYERIKDWRDRVSKYQR